jgi:predicted nucleic acid-binding protein
VKLYAEESGSAEMRGLVAPVISCLARVEVPAAIWRKSRSGELAATDAATLTAEFEADYYGDGADDARFIALSLPDQVLVDAAAIAASRGLRSYDAVQLASARAARSADPGCSSFACYDQDLRSAAAADGFGLIPEVP